MCGNTRTAATAITKATMEAMVTDKARDPGTSFQRAPDARCANAAYSIWPKPGDSSAIIAGDGIGGPVNNGNPPPRPFQGNETRMLRSIANESTSKKQEAGIKKKKK